MLINNLKKNFKMCLIQFKILIALLNLIKIKNKLYLSLKIRFLSF